MAHPVHLQGKQDHITWQAEAMQTCPGFFLKSLLESPGNLLEICSVKFVDTLYADGV